LESLTELYLTIYRMNLKFRPVIFTGDEKKSFIQGAYKPRVDYILGIKSNAVLEA